MASREPETAISQGILKHFAVGFHACSCLLTWFWLVSDFGGGSRACNRTRDLALALHPWHLSASMRLKVF